MDLTGNEVEMNVLRMDKKFRVSVTSEKVLK